MTSIDNLADEIMQGLQEYAELADDAMKEAVKKTATSVKRRYPQMLQGTAVPMRKAGKQQKYPKTAINCR